MDLNSISIIGRLTDNCVFKTLPTGTAIAEFSIANNRGYGQNAKAHFFNVKLIGKGAEAINQYLTKGTQVAISGELTQETWEGATGKQSKIVIVTFAVELLASPKSQSSGGGIGGDKEFNSKYCVDGIKHDEGLAF